ncbi:conserved hypothetical protein [Ricinus communis]|uniref:Uncharacterized protein n=1 Tax=Ricinus communis TaxID=3988 RepID=B9T9I7_RICCO|nr:conserved hypothetical protein [Ricinus communis]
MPCPVNGFGPSAGATTNCCISVPSTTSSTSRARSARAGRAWRWPAATTPAPSRSSRTRRPARSSSGSTTSAIPRHGADEARAVTSVLIAATS